MEDDGERLMMTEKEEVDMDEGIMDMNEVMESDTLRTEINNAVEEDMHDGSGLEETAHLETGLGDTKLTDKTRTLAVMKMVRGEK